MADEVARRAVHAAGTLIPVPYLLGRPPFEVAFPIVGTVPWSWVVGFVLAGTALAVVLEALRLRGRLDWWIYDVLTRDYEQDNPAGYFLYAVGLAVVVVAFPPTVAIPAMFMLTIGDPISGLLGSTDAAGVKGPVVLGVMFVVCFLVAVPFVGVLGAVLGAAVATVADGVKPVVAGYVIDDNLTIPVGGGLAMWAAVLYLPLVAA